MTALFNDVVNVMKLDECVENEHGLWRIVMLESNSKRLAITAEHRIIEARTRSEDSSKAQNERKIGKLKITKEIEE